MSAIWGCVDLSGAPVPERETAEKMQKALSACRIDRTDYIAKKDAVMGCALQYTRIWAENEVLPLYDEETNTLFTADCLVDNRAKLISELCPGQNDIPDAALLFLAYKKYGPEMAHHVYGAYSYAAWNTAKKELVLGIDHVASRALYYQRVGDRVYFGTRIESITNASGKKELDETWIALFLGQVHLTYLTDPAHTPYKDVVRMPAYHYSVITQSNNRSIKFWDFDDIKPLKLKNDNEYKEAFRDVFSQCVTESIQGTKDKVGILLSGGFDSTTIGSQAATELARQGKELLGYTHVPVENYKNAFNPEFIMTNEQNAVLEFCKMYPNVKPSFLSTPSANGYTELRDVMSMYETPYKSLTNVNWIYHMYQQAGHDGCRIVLTGQSGNGTISWGKFEDYIQQLSAQKNYYKVFLTSNRYCKMRKFSRKKYFKALINEFLHPPKMPDDYFANSLLNREFAQKLGIKVTDKRLEGNVSGALYKNANYKEIRRLCATPNALAHIADAETPMSLHNGFVLRDPSRDIRIMEFCSAIPLECFVNSVPETRRLVRKYCADLIPTSFLPEHSPRGRQSADWKERLLPQWDAVYADMQRVCLSPNVLRFVDEALMKKTLESHRIEPSDDYADFLLLSSVYSVGVFLEKQGF